MAEQGYELDYITDKLGIIEELISGYSGNETIIRELLQNAQDAGKNDKFIEFRLNQDRMIVRHNAAPFNESNWKSITRIASRDKKKRLEQIGAFGIGFVSVYQITDHPEIRSGGQRLVLNPKEVKHHTEPIPDDGLTEFHFPYRGNNSEIGHEIGASPFGPERIKKFLEIAGEEIYRSFLFLDTVKRVYVFRDDLLIAHVQKEISYGQANGIPYQRLNILWECKGQKKIGHEWIILHQEFQRDLQLSVQKRNTISIAFNVSDPRSPIASGMLYNYLPAELLNTKLLFHINIANQSLWIRVKKANGTGRLSPRLRNSLLNPSLY